MVNKTHKIKKSKGQRGTNHYHGARKKWKGSGHHGGVGMAGAGKRADQKKTLVIKLYGHKYFGKQGITSKSTEKKKLNVINLGDIQKNLDSLMKKHGKRKDLDLRDYKILGEGELNEGLKIKAKSFSESAKKKIEKAGGEAIIFNDEESSLKKTSEKVSVKREEIKERKTIKTKIAK